MADQYGAPFGTYTISGQGLSGGQKTAINAAINSFLALINGDVAITDFTTQAGSLAPPHPDFDKINPGTRQKLVDEINALTAAVTAST